MLCKSVVFHRHGCVVFLPNLSITIRELSNCSCRGWLTFLNIWYWLDKPEQKIDNELHCNSNEFENHLSYKCGNINQQVRDIIWQLLKRVFTVTV